MVPDWMKMNDGPAISVKVMAGIPNLTPEEMRDLKKMKNAYDKQSFGDSTRKLHSIHLADSVVNAHKLINGYRYTFQCEWKPAST
jgi:hypothetical protein